MGNIFLKLLNMSITAGWLILAVLCIRLLFRKMPKWVNCLLWGVAAVRLVCPVSIESRFSVLPSAEPVKSSTIVEGEVQNYIPSIDSRLPIVENTINPMLAEGFAHAGSDSAAPLQVSLYAAGLIWGCGMLLLTICAMGSAVKLRRLVRESVRVRDNIYICDAVKSPFILGLVRPRIYLSSALGKREMDYILAHEAAHLKRKDHWWKALGYLLLCIYWFNPLCWVAYSLFCKDIELACDEKTARNMTLHEKKEYSRVLLSCAGRKSLIMVCPLAFGEVGVKERVKSVLNYKKPALWIMLAAAAVCVILPLCFLTNPAEEYRIRIIIPAGSTEPVCYSEEEISPKGRRLVFYADAGLGDTEISLLPIEVREENAYDEPVYITPGMPAEMAAEKGAWYKIGVNIQNPTDESRTVYVSVKNVEVRIASSEGAGDSTPSPVQVPDGEAAAQQDTSAAAGVSGSTAPSKEQVLAAREAVLEGMTTEQIERLTENIKVANIRMEWAYLYDNIFGMLEDENSLYWNYFDQKGDIQIGWTYDGGYYERKEIQERENLTTDEFYEMYGTPVVAYNRFDAGNFIDLITEMQESVQNENLRGDLQRLIDETALAKDTHDVEHAENIYEILHDMDYYLLRYGLEDVGIYVKDASVLAKYYGVLSVYRQ